MTQTPGRRNRVNCAAATMLSRVLVLKVSGWRPVERMIRSRLFRPFVRRFVPGETVEEAVKVAEDLAARGYFISLDLLGENVHSEAEAAAAASVYSQMVDAIAKSSCSKGRESEGVSSLPPIETTNISIKLTQCGLDQGDAVAEGHYRSVVEQAARHKSFVRVDMEGSDYTERTVRMVERVFDSLGHTGTVLQSYLHRTPKDIEWAIERQIRIRLVKGAYLEPEEVALQSKAKVDEAYAVQAERLLEAGFYPAFATHDANLVRKICEFAAARQIDKDRFEFQMLYGIRRDLQERLLKEGYRVRIYIPFGDSWYPYFSRRLAERPANIFFLLKSLFRR
jgi:proline dehydrogenase